MERSSSHRGTSGAGREEDDKGDGGRGALRLEKLQLDIDLENSRRFELARDLKRASPKKQVFFLAIFFAEVDFVSILIVTCQSVWTFPGGWSDFLR